MTAAPTAEQVREHLGARGSSAKCPAHQDAQASLSISENPAGKVLLKCHAGCSQGAVINALQARGIWPKSEAIGLTVAQLAAAKHLPEKLLRDSGFADDEANGRPVVRMDYRGPDGKVSCVRYRGALDTNGGGPKFWFRKGDKQQLFGLWRLRPEPVILVEGETDSLALWAAGFNAVGVPGAEAWHERFASHLAHCSVIYVHIEPDNGGVKFRANFERSSLHKRVKFFTVSPAAKDPCELHAQNAEAFRGAIGEAQARGDDGARSPIEEPRAPSASVGFGGTGAGTVGISTWPDPKPLADALPSVESFTPELIPDSLRAWVMDVAERTQAPVEYVAVSAMVSLGAALGRKVAVRPKRLDDWCEFANLWGAVVGPPSWMKSPALDEGKRPLTVIEARILEGYQLTHREWEADDASAKVKRDGAKDRARKAARGGKGFDKMELVAEPIPEEPKPPRLIVNDATVPALCEVLRANSNGVLIFRDELAGLIAELDREGMEGSRGFYLTGWSGKDGHTQDRILRGTNLRVPYVCLSLLGGIQPARVAPLLKESIATGGGDGFLARFSLTVWPDSPGEYRAIDREPDEGARRAAQGVYERLHALVPADMGAELVDGVAPFLRLQAGAAEAFTAWDVELRNRLRVGGDDGALAAHLGKYPKAVCGLALLAHLADGGSGDISEMAVLRALAWSEFLESHARRLYACLGQAHIEAARSLLGRIRRRDLPSPFTLREVYRRGWAHLPDAEAARAAADVLEAHHYISGKPLETGASGGRPTVEYHVNPAVLAPGVQS